VLLTQTPNPSVLRGALVGGPNSVDVFNNERKDYVTNEGEVTIGC
jgi:hypothetical protein